MLRKTSPNNPLLERPALEKLLEEPPSRAVTWTATAIFSLVGIMLVGSAVYRIDVYATAPGRIEPIGHSKSIEAPEQARIVSIDVQEGRHVTAGQVLLRLDPTAAIFDREAARNSEKEFSAEIARRYQEQSMMRRGKLAASLSDSTPERRAENVILGNDLRDLKAEQADLRSKIASDQAQASTLRVAVAEKTAAVVALSENLEHIRQLQAEGWKSRADLDSAEVDRRRATADRLATVDQLHSVEGDASDASAQLELARAKMMKSNSDNLESVLQQQNESQQQFLKANSRTSSMTIRSPVNGTVQGLAISNIGEVANLGEDLMTIVPDTASLQIEALVSDQDIGFVKAGQDVTIKVRAFPFSRYGVLHGRVVKVARDSLNSKTASTRTDSASTAQSFDNPDQAPLPDVSDLVYPVMIQLNTDTILIDGNRVKLRAGMAVDVDIRTATRTVIEYLLSPIVEALSNSGHEP